jgi:hypothetical protein
VLEELTVLVILYNLMHLVMLGSATLQHTAVERISFRDALRWLSTPNSGRPLVALILMLYAPLGWRRAARSGGPRASRL